MIRVEGLSLEKFLNLAAREGLFVFDTFRRSYTVLSVNMSARDFSKLKKIVSGKHSLTVEKRRGIPFGLLWIFRRKALMIGLVVIAFVMFAASLYVWDVRVTGLEDTANIKEELSSYGVALGTYKQNVDLSEIATKIIVAHDEIAWIDISFKGVVVVVEIVPAIRVPEVVDENTPCDVVASKDAYIIGVTARAGRATVKVGDTVRKGDMLISGLVWDEGKKRIMFAARGEVVGNVWYTATISQPIFEQTRQKTGNTQSQRVIFIGSDSADIDEQCRFAQFDTVNVDEYYLGERLFLPVKVVTYEHSEVIVTKTPVPLEILKVILEEKAYNEAQAKMQQGILIVSHKAFFEVSDDKMTVTVYLKTQEDIGRIVYLKE